MPQTTYYLYLENREDDNILIQYLIKSLVKSIQVIAPNTLPFKEMPKTEKVREVFCIK